MSKVMHAPLTAAEEVAASSIVAAAYAVHRELGPGLLESVYETCFCHELAKAGRRVAKQVRLPIVYDGLKFQEALRLDVLVDELVICEPKVAETLHPVYIAQVLSYLKLSGKRLGFLINFNVPIIKDGIRRIVL
jgi:GxxExxY protein